MKWATVQDPLASGMACVSGKREKAVLQEVSPMLSRQGDVTQSKLCGPSRRSFTTVKTPIPSGMSLAEHRPHRVIECEARKMCTRTGRDPRRGILMGAEKSKERSYARTLTR